MPVGSVERALAASPGPGAVFHVADPFASKSGTILGTGAKAPTGDADWKPSVDPGSVAGLTSADFEAQAERERRLGLQRIESIESALT